MTLKLGHWTAIAVTTLGVVVSGLAILPAFADYKVALYSLGSFLVTGGTGHLLILPSIKDDKGAS